MSTETNFTYPKLASSSAIISSANSSQTKKFVCTHQGCDKSFSRKYSLKSHFDSKHLGLDFKCQKCDRLFSDKHNLITHMRIHTGEKPYECEVCGQRFNTSGNMKDHLRRHSKTK